MLEKLLPFPEIETERLRLRKFRPTDLMDMHAVMRDAEVPKCLSWKAHETLDETREVLERVCADYETGDGFRWAIALKDGDRFIGMMIVKPVFQHNRVNIGYWMGRPWWGNGLMTEALSATIKLCFEQLGVNRVEADHYEDNPASGRVMEKAGMAYEGMLAQYCLGKDGQYHGCRFYAITKDRYQQSCPTSN